MDPRYLRPTATTRRSIRYQPGESAPGERREGSRDGRARRRQEESPDEGTPEKEAEREPGTEPGTEPGSGAETEPESASPKGGGRIPRFSRSTLTILVVVILVTAGLWWGLTELTRDEGPTAHSDYLLEVWASGLDRPIALTAGPEGSLFVGQGGSPGEVLKLGEVGGNITANQWVTGTSVPMGLVWTLSSWLYVSHRGRLNAYRDSIGDGAVDRDMSLITDLPTSSGDHLNNGMVLGADGFLYLAVGSTCDSCPESDERSATILRVNPNDGNHTIFATGLRNSLDLAWRTGTGELFAVDNSRVDKDYPEELNLIVEGGDYGWPNSTGGILPDTIGPVGVFPAHSKPWGLVFTPDSRFTGSTGEAIVALNGLGKVVVVNLTLDPVSQQYGSTVRDLVVGLESPTDLVFGPEGELYIADSKLGQVLKLTRL